MGIVDQIKDFIPEGGGGASVITGGSIGAILSFVLLITLVVGGVMFVLFRMMQFKYKITVFESIAGQGTIPVGKDRAKLIKAGDGGEVVLYLRKHKVYRKAYGKKIGKNHFAFVIGDDGLWYNIEFGEFNKELNVMGLKPIDPDMRHFNVAIRRNISQRFDQKSWLKENIGLLVGITSIIIVLIFLWLIFREFSAITGASQRAVESAKEVLQASREVIGALDNVVSSSGVQSA